MKKLFLCTSIFLLSICVFVACGSDDPSSEASLPGNKKTTSGIFQVNAGGTKVCFAPGNLQATYNGSTWNWAFAANQWDYIGYDVANLYINGDGKVSVNGTVDLFGWVGESSIWTGVTQYGISDANAVNSRYTYGNIASEALKSDWGNTISDGYKWRTLSYSEWLYVFNTRIGSTVNNTSNARYTIAIIKTEDRTVKGILLFPDGITLENGDATSWGEMNATTKSTRCTSAQWANLAAKGCVFLPAAGYRVETSVRNYDYGCYYWSSSSHTTNVYAAYAVSFDAGYLNPARSYARPDGLSVRLVREVE
jgi:hypothetical protein